jgi:hypothetical protein
MPAVFLTDANAFKLATFYNVNIVFIAQYNMQWTIQEYCCFNPNNTCILLYNPGDGHFRSVQEKNTASFTFTFARMQQIIRSYQTNRNLFDIKYRFQRP